MSLSPQHDPSTDSLAWREQHPQKPTGPRARQDDDPASQPASSFTDPDAIGGTLAAAPDLDAPDAPATPEPEPEPAPAPVDEQPGEQPQGAAPGPGDAGVTDGGS
jgi:hypothetical protein